MNSIERFYATIERRPTDRPAVWLGMPDPAALSGLLEIYGAEDLHALKAAVGDDIYAVEVPYLGGAIHSAFDWYGGKAQSSGERTLTAAGCFRDCESIDEIERFDWPDPALHMDPDECLRSAAQVPEGKAGLGMLWSAHFQDTCAAFGMETALMNMVTEPELYRVVDEKVVDFYLQANAIFLEATRGRLHAVLIGNDMGSQRGLMLSPELVRTFILPGAKKLVAQAHEYGVKVIYHSCGAIADIIPDLIEIGVDAVHPIQALAAGMGAAELKERFGGRISFCGGVDTQDLLVHASPDAVAEEARRLRELFPTGLILSPSHEAILPDVPPENIKALFAEATGST